MKKTFKLSLLIIILAAVLLISACIIFVISSADEITSSEKTLKGTTMLLNHETKKGEEIELPISVTSNPVGEDLYLINIFFDNQSDNKNYNVKNGKMKITLDNSVEIPMMFYSSGDGSNYLIPSVSYPDDKQTFECTSDNGYLDLRLLLSGEETENLKLAFSYSIIGNGIYSFNKFYGFEETFGLDDFI